MCCKLLYIRLHQNYPLNGCMNLKQCKMEKVIYYTYTIRTVCHPYVNMSLCQPKHWYMMRCCHLNMVLLVTHKCQWWHFQINSLISHLSCCTTKSSNCFFFSLYQDTRYQFPFFGSPKCKLCCDFLIAGEAAFLIYNVSIYGSPLGKTYHPSAWANMAFSTFPLFGCSTANQ